MKIYIDLFLTGVALSWGPCLAFCAPIVLPFIAGTQKGWRGGLKLSLAFSLGRIVPYIILSIVSAGIGQYIVARFYQTNAALIIQYVSGAFIVLLGILVVSGKSLPLHFCKPFQKPGVKSTLQEALVLGLVLGAAPCLPLLGVLAYIGFHAQNLLHGALLGLAFALGTLLSPILLAGSLAGGLPKLLERKPMLSIIFQRFCGIMLLYLGISMLVMAVTVNLLP